MKIDEDIENEDENEDNMDNNSEIKNFYSSQKSFLLTFPRCDIDKETAYKYFLVKFKPIEIIVSQELHKDGFPHLHIWLCFDKRITIRNSRYFDMHEYHCNISKMINEKRNSKYNVIKYLLKYDKNPICYGMNFLSIGKRLFICENLKNGGNLCDLIDKYPEELYNYDKLRKNVNLYNIDKQKVNKNISRKCYWIYGESGIGKSYLVRESFDKLYEKQNNKWWDGYNNEDAVLIDDFDETCIGLSYYLKIWGDNYRFKAEIKCGVIQPIYTKLIITSNYSIDILFSNKNNTNKELIKALKRRFEEIHMINKDEQNNIINLIKN